MTISTTTRKAGPFAGNGVTTVFPFVFKVLATADLRVIKTSTLGVDTNLTLGVNYTVLLNADQDVSPGGTVTYATLAIGEKLTIVSNQAITQPTDLTNGGGFYPDVIELALDRTVIEVQQVNDTLLRTMKFPASDSSALGTELPTAANRALRALVFTADGSVGVSGGEYDDQAGDAAASAAAALASANASAVSAAAAAVSATTAGTQATSAAASATAASGSATAAAGSATASALSATASAGSATAAAASYDSFDDRYLGVKAADPTLDNDGAALLNGALYFNSASNWMLVYSTGTASWGRLNNNTLLNGSGAPAGALGYNGDFYFDTTNYLIYGPKTAGAWGGGTSIIGPSGPGTGDVTGPASSTNDALAVYNGTTGKVIKQSALTGLLKLTAGVTSAAVSGTDYAPATSGSAIQKGNGAGGFSAAVAATDYAAVGAVTGTGITMATARLLGRTTAGTGAIEQISIGSNLTLTGGVLDTVPLGYVPLATITPTASATADALNVFTSDYDSIIIEVNGLKPSADDSLVLRVAVAGAADSSAGAYFKINLNGNGTSGATSVALQTGTQTLAAGKGISGFIKINNINSTTSLKTLHWMLANQSSAAPQYNNYTNAAVHTPANVISGVRFYWATGANFVATGSIRIYGIKN